MFQIQQVILKHKSNLTQLMPKVEFPIFQTFDLCITSDGMTHIVI